MKEEDMSFEPTVDNVFIYNEGFQDGKVEGRKEVIDRIKERLNSMDSVAELVDALQESWAEIWFVSE